MGLGLSFSRGILIFRFAKLFPLHPPLHPKHNTHNIDTILIYDLLGSQTPDYQILRAVTFIGMALLPLLAGPHIMMHISLEDLFSPGWRLLMMGGCYIFGAYIYASHVPERHFPGKFDCSVCLSCPPTPLLLSPPQTHQPTLTSNLLIVLQPCDLALLHHSSGTMALLCLGNVPLHTEVLQRRMHRLRDGLIIYVYKIANVGEGGKG